MICTHWEIYPLKSLCTLSDELIQALNCQIGLVSHKHKKPVININFECIKKLYVGCLKDILKILVCSDSLRGADRCS